jgi:hypothetical protein
MQHISDGLQVAINKIAVNNQRIIVELIIKNATKNRIYVQMYGATQVATDNGVSGVVEDVVGIPYCDLSEEITDNLSHCQQQNEQNINDYTYIEPGEFTTASLPMIMSGDLSSATAISFAFDAFVRSAPPNYDDLDPSDAAQQLSPPHLVMLNFPLVPLSGQ